MESLVFTPAALLDLLSKVDELSDYQIGISETLDGDLQLQIGDSIYMIDSNAAEDIVVDDSVVDELDNLNLETYEDLSDEGVVDLDMDPVESGIIKELAKTLLVGGMARLGAHMLKN